MLHRISLVLFVTLSCHLVNTHNVTSPQDNDLDQVTTMATMTSVLNSTTVAPSMLANSTTTSTTTESTLLPVRPKRLRPSPFLQPSASTRKNAQLKLAAEQQQKDAVNNQSTVMTSKDGVAKTSVPRYKAPPMLKKIHDWMIVVLLVAVMFAMGCSITWDQVSLSKDKAILFARVHFCFR